MKWFLWLECLVGRHEFIDFYSGPPQADSWLEPQGQICVRCNKIREKL